MGGEKTSERALTFAEAVQEHTDAGWKVISDGPSGVQLEGTKQMKGLDKACLVLGIITVFWGIGFLFILLALLDYWLMTKSETRFIARY